MVSGCVIIFTDRPAYLFPLVSNLDILPRIAVSDLHFLNSEIMNLSKPSLLVVGCPSYTANDIESLRGKGFKVHILDLTDTPREGVLKRFEDLASRHNYNAMVLFSGSFAIRPLGEQIFSLFTPHLKLVSGLGAGFDSGTGS